LCEAKPPRESSDQLRPLELFRNFSTLKASAV